MASSSTEHWTCDAEKGIEVVSWRRDELLRAGYEQLVAGELARRTDIDLHRAIALVRAGCPSGLARRILV